MNTIQISRGDLALRLKESAGYLKPGEYFIQTTTFNNKGTWTHAETGDKVTLVKDAITGFKYTPQEGDIFIGVPEKESTGTYSLTRIGSSHSLINQYSFTDGKFSVKDADSIVNSTTVDRTYEPNHLYMYSDSAPTKDTGLRNIDGKPIELADTDVFIYLGEGYYTEGEEEPKLAKYAIKMSGSNSVKFIKFPQVKNPENDSKSNQNHSFYSDSSLLDILYDIDRLKLSHYESSAVVMGSEKEFAVSSGKGSHKLKAVYAGAKVKGADYRFVKKSELLKFFLGFYCENNGGTYREEDFSYQVARIQGTEWKFYKDPVDEEKSGRTRIGGMYTNTPIIVIDDKKLSETDNFDSDFVVTNFFKSKTEDPDSPILLNTDALGSYVIKDGLGKAVNVFFPNDEFVIKVKPGVLDDSVRPSNNLQPLTKENADVADDEGTEVVQIKLDLDDIEISRRGDGSNPNYDPTNGKDGKDLGPADPTDPHPRFGHRANDVADNYWQEEDAALKTNEDGIVSLFKSKADVDDEGHIFTSQLPRTVVGGMQRRGTISDLYSFLIFATEGFDTTLSKPNKDGQEYFQTAAGEHGYTKWEDLLRELGLDKLFETDENGKLIKSKIDVGDYFIYSGPKLEVGTKEGDENWGKTNFKEDYIKYHLNLEENPNATPWFYKPGEKRARFEQFTLTDLLAFDATGKTKVQAAWSGFGEGDDGYKGLLNGLKGVNYIKPGDIFVIEKITTGDTVAPVDEQSRDPHANPDTEDGFVLQLSLISSAADAVTGLIIENNNSETEKTEVTGAITLKPKKRDGTSFDETEIKSQGKNTIILGTESVLWSQFKSEGDTADYSEVDPAIPLIDKHGLARHSNAKFMPDWSLNLGALKSEEFISPVVVEEGEFNPFASIRNAANLIIGASDASSLSLKFATTKSGDKFTQVFQAENGVIALLGDLDDTPPEDEDSMKTQLHWHVRKEYVKTGDDEDGNPIYKVQYHNSFLRDGGGKECDVDSHKFDDDGKDSNFVDNWNNGVYKKKGEEGFKQEERDRAFVFYNREQKTVKDTDGRPLIAQKKQTVKFVLASVENQDTTFESVPDDTKELESVQTLPRHSGVLLNSRSIIDCGEWL